MHRYSVADAKNHLPELLREVEAGGPVEIARRGEPVAVVVSIEEWRRLTAKRQNFVTAMADWRARFPATEEDEDDPFADTRDRSPGREPPF